MRGLRPWAYDKRIVCLMSGNITTIRKFQVWHTAIRVDEPLQNQTEKATGADD